MKKILAISGSTRRHSANLQLLQIIAGMAPAEFTVEIYEGLAELPHFNPDLDVEPLPPSVAAFRAEIEAAAGVLICTPEYVFSLPGALKNALEWTVSTILFLDKPVALMTASSLGEHTHQSLQLVLKTLGARWSPPAALLIQGVRSKLNSAGEIADAPTQQQVQNLLDSFIGMMNGSHSN